MKTFFQVFCFILICSVVATGNCAESYRANGVIDLVKKQGIRSTRVFSNVVSGVPINLNAGELTFSLVFVVEPPPSDKYSLMVSLLTNPKSTDGFSTTVLTGTFQSSLVGGGNGPLEFEWNQAISVLSDQSRFL
ncbi:MAG: hypothetical protein L3J83_05670 [Proteobacteria bacterium]|nr:hypothetical protein [Pseudomonadota bacterium]